MLVHVQLDGAERAYALTEFEDLVRAGVVGPETPVRIDAVTGEGWAPARTLDLWRSLVDAPAAWFSRAWSPPAIPWVTAAFVGVCIRVHLWAFGVPGLLGVYDALRNGSGEVLEGGQSWRLLSYATLHGSAMHIANNMLFLVLGGMALEVVLGSTAVAALVLASAFVGGLASVLVGGTEASVGASAVDFGFLSAAIAFGARFLDLIPPRRRAAFGAGLGLFAVWGFVNGLLGDGVDNAAHAGGIVAGLLLGAILRPADPAGRRWNARVAAAVTLAVAAGLAVVSVAGPRMVPFAPEPVDGVAITRPASWRVGWSPAGGAGWASPTGRGLVTAATLKRGVPSGVAESSEQLVAAYVAVDPGASVLAREPATVGGVEGERLVIGWTREGAPWRTDALVLPRGRYLTTVTVEVPEGADGLRSVLDARVLDAAELTVPEAVGEAEAGGSRSVRARVALATARSDIGDLDGAVALLREGIAAAPAEARLRAALVTELAAWGRPEARAEVAASVAALPDNRSLRATCARALAELGDAGAARALLEAGLAVAPGDRTLTRALAELPPP